MNVSKAGLGVNIQVCVVVCVGGVGACVLVRVCLCENSNPEGKP